MVEGELPEPKYIYVASDATGGTGERVVRSALTQFSTSKLSVQAVPRIQTPTQVRELVAQAAERHALIAYTFVSIDLRNEIALSANERRVVAIDLLGPLLTALSRFFTATPLYATDLLYNEPSEEHYRHLDATTFTVRHDDGQGLRDLEEADVVIVGPSRTCKTPLSVYLAYTRGLKVANVPLALGVEPCVELKRLSAGNVVATTMQVELLARVRGERQANLGASDIVYSDPRHVARELEYCHRLYRSHPNWSVIDVTGRAIEEIAAQVFALTTRSGR